MVIRCLPAGTAARDGVPVVFRRADRIGRCGQLFRLRDLSDPDPWLHPGQLPGGLFGGGYLQYLPDHREILRHRVGDYVCIGFFIAYFLAFQLRSRTSQTVLLLLCSIPFWTSIVIRMIAWIPLLGRNGLVNRSLLGIGVVEGPQE